MLEKDYDGSRTSRARPSQGQCRRLSNVLVETGQWMLLPVRHLQRHAMQPNAIDRKEIITNLKLRISGSYDVSREATRVVLPPEEKVEW